LERKHLLESTPKSTWVDIFSKYRNIQFLNRAVLAELVEDILIDNEGKAEVVFQGHDKIEEMVGNLEGYLGNDKAEESPHDNDTEAAIAVGG